MAALHILFMSTDVMKIAQPQQKDLFLMITGCVNQHTSGHPEVTHMYGNQL